MPRRSLPPSDVAAAAVLVLFVAALGLAPHLKFSVDVGELAFFKSAFDEDTYFRFMLRDVFDPHRTLGHYALRSLDALAGHSADLTLILADLVFPSCAVVAAYFLASRVVARWPARTVLALGLIFGQDLLSLANLSIWPGGRLSLASFRRLFGPWGPITVPYPEVSYLTIFRTQEPQVTYAVVFVFLGLLVGLATAEGGPPSRRLVTVVGCLTVLLPFTYIVVSLPALGIACWLAALLFVTGRPRLAIGLSAIVVVAILVFGVTCSMSRDQVGVFPSRWPIVTPAILLIVLTIVPLTVALARSHRERRSAWLGLGFLLVPVALSNQQVLTGIMISARDWERNINYQFLLLGLVLALRPLITSRGAGVTRVLQYVAVLAALSIAFEVARAQTVTFRFWLPQNLATVAMKRAVDAAGAALPSTTRLLLDQPQLAPHLGVRTGDRFTFVLDFTDIALHFVPSIDPQGRVPHSPHEGDLFEHWWRTGTSPAEAERVLLAEAAQRGGYFLGFLFSITDYWYPGTDNRRVRQAEIVRAIPEIIERYRVCERCRVSSGGDVAFLTSREPSALRPPAGLGNRLLSTGRAGDVLVYLYRQQRTEGS